jgi:hypothetical protein
MSSSDGPSIVSGGVGEAAGPVCLSRLPGATDRDEGGASVAAVHEISQRLLERIPNNPYL